MKTIETNETQKPKSRDFFKINTPQVAYKRIREKVEAMSLQEVKKEFVKSSFESIYQAALFLKSELNQKNSRRAVKAANYVLEKLFTPTVLKNMALLKEKGKGVEKEIPKEFSKIFHASFLILRAELSSKNLNRVDAAAEFCLKKCCNERFLRALALAEREIEEAKEEKKKKVVWKE